MTKAWDYMPGVPLAGYVTSGGYWHPGNKDNCNKCEPPRNKCQVRGCLEDAEGIKIYCPQHLNDRTTPR